MKELIGNNDLFFGDYCLKILDNTFASKLLDYYQRNYNFFSTAMPFIPIDLLNEELCSRFLDSDLEDLFEFKKYHYYIFHQSDLYLSQIIGDIAVSNIIQYPLFSGILGYNIDIDFINQGLATKSVKTIIEFSFEILKLHRLEAFTMIDNIPSQKILLKNGFVDEGIACKYLKVLQEWQDHKRFALINNDF